MIDKVEQFGYTIGTKEIDIIKAKNLYQSMSIQVEQYAKLQELSFSDYVETVKSNVRYYPYVLYIEDAKKWLDMREGKLDRRKKYEEEFAFNKLQTDINNDILNQDCIITKIYWYGAPAMAWIIEFQYFDDTFELYIPKMEELKTKNFHDLHDGQLAIGIEDKNGNYTMFAFSYEESDIQKQFNDYIKELVSIDIPVSSRELNAKTHKKVL